MAQGGLKSKASKNAGLSKKQRAKVKAQTKKQRERLVRKGNPGQKAKTSQRKLQAIEQSAITKEINKKNEQMLAGKAIQGGDTLFMRELKTKGKEITKEIRRNALKKKESRIEEKLAKAKEKLGRLDEKSQK
mmetsp:Transcript_36106/g.52889  ORF Transcript_36106/g.52889 Transcript_36106/m.52889 type:complete len:132 (+) Transcript_36106:28-423(+)|eukprot:CAMPEP_0194558000 /NCGR_PEP_ID=MMETSP0292-20121207/78_1 /TAXON_ID=39354 /ORGANISM="Heterosigma akashiwo, Strain CCMP2393" /LENGTH=131 /DNA_ID=CAMNT_0039405537 /DNA_START=21 /DNA_END=416 /DNA_ORIENTATION=+